MQLLGPCKKVMRLKGLFGEPPSSSHRSGLNSSASGPQIFLLRLIAQGLMTM